MTPGPSYLFGLVTLAAAASTFAACGDGPTCPSEIVVVIQSPSPGANLTTANDQDPDVAGIQTSIEVRTNLKRNDDVVLTITDERTGAVAQVNGKVDSDGDVSFASVTLPGGPVTLHAEGSSDCGTGADEIEINVIAAAVCDLSIDEGPIANDFYAPIPVLNASNDSDSALPNFQANITVQSAPGFDVEVFALDISAGSEASLGNVQADGDGIASFQTTLAQGLQVVRATCTLNGASAASAANTVQVDTIVPTCTLSNPAEGVTVTPDDDADSDLSNGIQMTWTGRVNDNGEGDTTGESAFFSRDTTVIDATNIDADGNSASVALAGFGAPGTFATSFESQDHAGNVCVDTFNTNVIMDGCSISIDAPSTTVVADSDGNGANGLQSDFTVTVATECVGQTVSIKCGTHPEVSATAPTGGVTNFSDVRISSNAVSEGTVNCTARVTNPDNFQTTNDRLVSFDTQAPGGTLGFTFPSGLACGDTILRDVANDSTGTLADGFHIKARVIAPLANTRDIAVTNATCTTPCLTAAPAGGVAVDVEIVDGPNDIRALTRDAVGNEASTPECIVRLEDIAVDIVDPVGTGLLSSNSGGTINADGDLEITVCATSSDPLVTASLDVTDLSTAVTTTETMTFNAGLGQFCTDNAVVFAEGNYQLIATVVEIAGTLQGSDTVNLTVDLTAPAAPTGLDASSPNRQDIDVSWAPAQGVDHYVLKFSTTPFTADFANEGTEVAGVGTLTEFTITPLNAGTDYFVGVASSDAAGNLSAAETVGPIRPELDPTGAIVPPDLATASAFARRFGQSIVSGRFNGDLRDDIAVSAPLKTVGANNAVGEVYIYFGTANGIGDAPDVTIVGDAPFATLGFSMTRLNWSAGTEDGLAISAPFSNRVFIFHGSTLSSGATTLTVADADVEIVVNPTANWFTNGTVGWSISSGELNSNTSVEDLIIGVPQGNSTGGALVIYGAANVSGTITLSETATSADMLGLQGHLFQNPVAAANGSALGHRVVYLGDTRAGDGVGDVAVAYAADATGGLKEDDAFYILRGRATTGVGGITFTTLRASDLRVENPTADNSNAFATTIGSIEDQNGDGFRDVVVGGNRDGSGHVWIFSAASTGTLVLTNSTNYLTKISAAAPGTPLFGSAVANNVDVANADINGDGSEDLVITGGTDGDGTGTTFPGMFIWYGGSIPLGDTTAASADYVIEGPAEFKNNNVGGQPNTFQAAWAGDVNNDGLPDLCWADWSAGAATESQGRMEILWDEPTN